MLGLPNSSPKLRAYAAPAAGRIGSDLTTVCVDFEERVFRMGYGDLEVIKKLQGAGIAIQSSPSLRMGLLVVDDQGFVFTPTALLLEAENHDDQSMNAMRLTPPRLCADRAGLAQCNGRGGT